MVCWISVSHSYKFSASLRIGDDSVDIYIECSWTLFHYLSFYAVVFVVFSLFFLFKQNMAYDMRISDWSSDVCSSDLSISTVVPDREGVKPFSVTTLARVWWRVRLDGHEAATSQCFLVAPTGVDPVTSRFSVERYGPKTRGKPRKSAVEVIGRAWCRDRLCESV